MVAVNLRTSEYDVYIGRPGQGLAGPWGNKFYVGRDGNREQVIVKYYFWMRERIARGEISDQDLAALHGKRLGCFCAPLLCHGDVLTELAAEAYNRLTAISTPC